ncbi:unnamed protein product [[Candida] boidinii]|uniref:Unnamed protein product n=1 Tax=Candida boidinii TaxID=5477 RepID=A0A9W6SY19_CANBO|nr:hypothetical protein B5S30_g3437 [[Candida] boidinii]OWB85119.1 hypothetical protein B5S33_g3777 [[Candida] boidinii]GME68391.1 unnamed protein product [[Candida] boidinii]
MDLFDDIEDLSGNLKTYNQQAINTQTQTQASDTNDDDNNSNIHNISLFSQTQLINSNEANDFNFANFDIFKSASSNVTQNINTDNNNNNSSFLYVDNEAEVASMEKKASENKSSHLGQLLGLNSKLISNVMSRLNGKRHDGKEDSLEDEDGEDENDQDISSDPIKKYLRSSLPNSQNDDEDEEVKEQDDDEKEDDDEEITSAIINHTRSIAEKPIAIKMTQDIETTQIIEDTTQEIEKTQQVGKTQPVHVDSQSQSQSQPESQSQSRSQPQLQSQSQSKPQSQLSHTQISTNKQLDIPNEEADDESESEEITLPKHKSNLNSLFVAEDDDENMEIEPENKPQEENTTMMENIPNYKEMTREEKIQARINEKLKNRKIEEEKLKSKLLEEEKENQSIDKDDDRYDDDEYDDEIGDQRSVSVKNKKSSAVDEKKSLVKQNEILKKGYFVPKKKSSDKFDVKNLIDGFAKDSDNEDEEIFEKNKNNSNSPLTSPLKVTTILPNSKAIKSPILNILPIDPQSEKIATINNKPAGDNRISYDSKKSSAAIELSDSDSDNDIINNNSSSSKKTLLEFRRKFANKMTIKSPIKNKRIIMGNNNVNSKNLSKILKKKTMQQLKIEKEKHHVDESYNNKLIEEEVDMEELLQKERDHVKRLAEREREHKRRQKLLLTGELKESDDDEDDSEYSENDVEDDAESEIDEEEESNEKLVDNNIQEDDLSGNEKENLDPSVKLISTQDNSISLNNSANNFFKNMSLSDAFESTLPNNKSLKNLTGVDVVKNLQKKQEIVFDDNEYGQTSFELNNNDVEDNNVNDNSIDSNLSAAVSFSERENKNIFTAEDDSFIEQRHKILDSQNFLPDTQSDEISEHQKSFSLTQVIPENGQTQNIENDVDAEDGHDNDDDDDEEDGEDRVVVNSRKSRSLKSVFSPIREQEEPFSSQKSPLTSKKINMRLSRGVEGSQKEDDEDENDKADDESSSSDEEVESDHEDEETKLLRLERIRAAKKLHELKIKKKQLEYKKKGMGQILEQEAVESEDEWQGLGGIDGEGSDLENSEDEKMLDDGSNIKADVNKIRQNMAAEELNKDDEMIKKLYHDLKTGALRNRRARDGAYDLELSDEDEELARRFYAYRAQKQRDLLLQNKKISNLAKNESSKAFFESIASTSTKSYIIEDNCFGADAASDDENAADISFNELDRKNSKEADINREDPFVDNKKRIANEESVDIESKHSKKKIKITRVQIQKSLSFLNSNPNDEHEQNESLAYKQHYLSSDIEEDSFTNTDSFNKLKKKCSSTNVAKQHQSQPKRTLVAHNKKSKHASSSSKAVETVDSDEEVEIESEDAADSDDEIIGVFANRSHSVTTSFKRNIKAQDVQVSIGTKTKRKEVNVTTTSKSSGTNKASVTYLTSRATSILAKKSLSMPTSVSSLKAKVIEDSLKIARKQNSHLSSIARSGRFE